MLMPRASGGPIVRPVRCWSRAVHAWGQGEVRGSSRGLNMKATNVAVQRSTVDVPRGSIDESNSKHQPVAVCRRRGTMVARRVLDEARPRRSFDGYLVVDAISLPHGILACGGRAKKHAQRLFF